MKKRIRTVEYVLPPTYISQETASELDSTIVASLQKPHLFHPTLMPPRRLVLIIGQPGDEKLEGIVEFLKFDRNIQIIAVEAATDMTQIFDSNFVATETAPTVFLVNEGGSWPHYNAALAKLPTNYGIVCTSSVPPVGPMWNQFEIKILFGLPTMQQCEARLQWNVDAFTEHCKSHPELSKVEFDIDCQLLSTMTMEHIVADLDKFCQSVNYKVLGMAASGIQVVVDNDFCNPLLYRRGTESFLARRDTNRDLNAFLQALGRPPSALKAVPGNAVLANVAEMSQKGSVFNVNE